MPRFIFLSRRDAAPTEGAPTRRYSYVLDGALEHKDSMGSGSIIRLGDVQRR